MRAEAGVTRTAAAARAARYLNMNPPILSGYRSVVLGTIVSTRCSR
jgi:hypothetical protein